MKIEIQTGGLNLKQIKLLNYTKFYKTVVTI